MKNKKRLVRALISICVVAILLSCTHSLETTKEIWFTTMEDSSGNIIITGLNRNYWNSETDFVIVIPSYINDKPVTTLGHYAFQNYKKLKTIIIPRSVTHIATNAFYNCTSIETITIPNSVTFIDKWAFGSCTSLKTITIPNSITSISESTFSLCTQLKTIIIPDSVTSIGIGVFYKCTSLETIDFPRSLISIGDGSFQHCTSLKTVTIPNSVTYVGNWAFVYCDSLQTINFYRTNLPSIGANCFSNNDKNKLVFRVPRASLALYKSKLAMYVHNKDTQIIGEL